MTRPRKDLERVRDLIAEGHSVAETARRAGIPRGTVRTWLSGGLEDKINAPSAHHAPDELCPYVRDLSESTYSYLLGLYLGDGHLSRFPRDAYKLRIYQDDKYPFLIHQCRIAMRWTVPNVVNLAQRQGCKEIYSFSKHWICLLPQHGDGRKHKRVIALVPWKQWVAVERQPHMLLRGLIHSDGCRYQNRIGKKYSYASYGFSNRSDDIRAIFATACKRLGIHCRQEGSWKIAVTRRADVEKLDAFIGPKT
jgi:hypothetical protein